MQHKQNQDNQGSGRRVSIPESLVSTFLYASGDSIALLDAVGNFRLVNPVWLQAMEASSKSELIGRNWQDMWPAEFRSLAVDAMRRAHSNQSTQFSARCQTFKGTTRWFDVTVGPVCDAYGQLTRILVQARDVTAFKRREGDLETSISEKELALGVLIRQLESESQRLSAAAARAARFERIRFVGQFVGNVIHEFNNVLLILSGASRMFRRELTARTQAEVVSIIDRAILRGNDLVGQLFDLLRLDGGEPETVAIVEFLKATTKLLPPFLGSRIELHTSVDQACWPVMAGPGRLQAVLLNLIANAAEAMPDGGRLTIAARNCFAVERPSGLEFGNYVAFSITDTGRGMSPDVLARAGEVFFSTKVAKSGKGFGLASAFELAEQCKGKVTIKSGLDVGTTVTLYLPQACSATEEIAALASIAPELHGAATILIVSSDEMLRSHLAAMLRSLNYRVIEAASEEVGLAVLPSGVKIDLACIDTNADAELVHRLNNAQSAPPLILISDTAAMSLASKNLVFRKPIDEPLLARAILEKLGRSPASVLPAEALRLSDRLREKIRNPNVREVYDRWRSLAAGLNRLPAPDDITSTASRLRDHSCLLEVHGSGDSAAFRFVYAGNALTDKLGRDLAGETISAADHELVGSIGSAYRRGLEGVAHFDYARYSVGAGKRLLFERLILPLSDDLENVTHLFGLISFTEIDDSK